MNLSSKHACMFPFSVSTIKSVRTLSECTRGSIVSLVVLVEYHKSLFVHCKKNLRYDRLAKKLYLNYIGL